MERSALESPNSSCVKVRSGCRLGLICSTYFFRCAVKHWSWIENLFPPVWYWLILNTRPCWSIDRFHSCLCKYGRCIYFRYLVTPSVFSVFSVAGVAKHIDWFGPSGDRIEQNSPDITVTRNDESSSILTLYKAGTEDAGVYKCVATNGDQQAESTVKVKIFRKFCPLSELLISTSAEEREKSAAYWTFSISLPAQGRHIPPFPLKSGWIFHLFNKWSEDR